MEEYFNKLIEKKVLEILEKFEINPKNKNEETDNEETLLTSKQVVDMFNISKPTLYRWNKACVLSPIKCGRKCLYRKSEINELITSKIYD